MLPTPKNYAIWPSVMLADTLTEVTITPAEKAFLLFEGEEYNITTIEVNADEFDYRTPEHRSHYTVSAKDGVIRFSHTFNREQEHLIILEYGEKKLAEFTVFSLYKDLYCLRPMKGDLHSHSYRSDGKRDPSSLLGHYREQGYDFVALTDHNRFYPGGEIDETYVGVNLGITRVRGEEVHTPGSVVHIVHVGGSSSVADLYVNDREGFVSEIDEKYLSKVPQEIPEQYRTRYARAMWAVDKIHAAGGIAIFPHPYWRPGNSRAYNVCDELARILLTSGMFDAYELVGGMGQPGNNISVSLWCDLRAEGHRISVVGSSDVHGLEKSNAFPHLFTVCFAKDNSNEAIIEAVKLDNTVAVEATGDEYNRHWRAYGSHRLVTYAQFLLREFFPQMQRICQGEGLAMRAYSMHDCDKQLIELQVEQSEKFRLRFFGNMAPTVPDTDMIDFEERWRARHLESPITKGSGLDSNVITRQI